MPYAQEQLTLTHVDSHCSRKESKWILISPAEKKNLTVFIEKPSKNLDAKLYSSIKSQKRKSRVMLKSYNSEQPGQFLEQLLIVPDLRLRINYFTYTYELGQPRCCQSGRLAMQYYEFRREFMALCSSCTNHQKESLPEFLFCSRGMTDTLFQKKTKAKITSLKTKNRSDRLSVCLYARFKHEVEIYDRNSQSWAGHPRNNDIHDITCFSIKSFSCNISCGYWIGNAT